MKKIISTITLLFFSMVTVNAQIADGFYHIKNAGTGRYLSINDTDPSNYPVSESGSVNLNGICTYINYDSVAVSPSCVIYVKSIGDHKYDFTGQGSSFYNMTSGKLPIEITGSGIYKIHGTYKGFTKYLTDMSKSNKDAHLINTETGMDNWTFEPINTSNEYIGIRPDVKTADGSYYATIFAGYNFRFASPGMVAYYVNSAGGSGFTMKQITSDVIPASVPVIIKCNSENPVDNKILPVTNGGAEPSDNMLRGVYCALTLSKHFNAKIYNPTDMRVIGTSGDKLAFVKASADDLVEGKYLQANKAYLPVEGADDVMTEDGTGIVTIKAEEKNSAAEGIYTLTGVRLPDGVTPKAGVYIKDGKKVVIK